MSSQMSIHEEIKEQQQKTKDMSTKGKLQYFWYYYKVHTLVGIAVVSFVIMFIYQYVTNKDYAFYATIINADVTYIEDNQWGDEFTQYAEVDTEEYQVYIDTSMMLSDNDSTQYSMSNVEKLLAMLQTGTIDVIVADTDVFEGYAQNEYFMNLEEVLPEDILTKYKDCFYYTDLATIDTGDDDSFTPLDELPNPDDYIINHHDPASMKKPVAVGIVLPESTKIMQTGCYDYLAATDTTYQGYPSEAVLGIPVTSKRFDTVIKFLEFIAE